MKQTGGVGTAKETSERMTKRRRKKTAKEYEQIKVTQ